MTDGSRTVAHTVAVEDAIEDLRTLRDFVRWTVSQLNAAGVALGHGFDDPWDEAVMLVLRCMHLPWDSDNRVMDARLTVPERRQIGAWVRQRVEDRIPLAYLTGEAWFCGIRFRIDERALVPRSPIAELIRSQFAPWVDAGSVRDILDMCTGSGCIGIACASHFPDARVDCVDLSEDALDLAEENVAEHGLEGRVTLIYSDLFSALEGRRYDIIVSNPPYVDATDLASMPLEYRHEPEMGLAAGDDGLSVVRRMLPLLRRHLNPGGIAVIEVGNSGEALELAYPHVPFTWLEFEEGEGGVFLLTREDLDTYHSHFDSSEAREPHVR